MDFDSFLRSYERQPVQMYPNNVASNPIVSVNVVTYNHVKYIKQCLDGILMQEVDFEYEILLGDDESSDGTREICIKYAEKYPEKIRLFLHSRENNIGIGGQPTGRFNFIYNLFHARGKYIALCEGDDYWTDENKLQKQVEVLINNPNISICHHWHSYLIKKNGDCRVTGAPKLGHGYLNREIATVREIFQNKLRIKSRTMMIRRSAICPLPK